MKYLIVDDEKYARLRIKRLLENIDENTTIYEAENAEIAKILIRKENPNFMFLDINMPRFTGIELLKQIDNPPYTIFVTAHEEHALAAFNLNAVDFLLKPFNEERFSQALEKAKLFLSTSMQNQIILKDGSKIYNVHPDDIVYAQSEGNYINIKTKNQTYFIRQTLTKLSAKLPQKTFVKINRSTIINIHQVAEIRSAGHGDQIVILKSDEQFKVSRTHKKDI